MAKTVKKSVLKESVRRYIKERLRKEEEEMDARPEMDDMPQPEPESATDKFYSDLDSLEDTVMNDMGGNKDLLASIKKLAQQADNIGYPKPGGEIEGGKEIGM